MSLEWPWVVSVFYNKDVKPPKVPGTLAIRTVHKSEASADIEVSAAKSRSDVGDVIKTFQGDVIKTSQGRRSHD